MQTITFDKSAKKFILGAFHKVVDKEGYIVERDNTSQKVLTPDGQEIREDEFAGVKKGSEVYFKSDIISLVRIADEVENRK